MLWRNMGGNLFHAQWAGLLLNYCPVMDNKFRRKNVADKYSPEQLYPRFERVLSRSRSTVIVDGQFGPGY